MYTIYCHVFPNGKRYVGITKNDPQARWNNGKGYKTCCLVSRAIEKYGWDNIEHEILETVETKNEAEEKERFYISMYESNNPKRGYNILPGGDVATNEITDEMRHKLGKGWRGKKRSEEEKQKIGNGVKETFKRPESNGHFGMKHSEEARKKMSESQKKLWDDDRRLKASERMRERMNDPEYKNIIIENLRAHPPKAHRVISEEEKERRRKYMTGRFIGEKSPCSKPVLQFDKNGVFIKRWANAGEVERAGIANRRNVSNVCSKKPHYYTAGGYVWKWEDVV